MSGESVNPNTPVTNVATDTQGKATIDAGGGPLTFDELDQLTSKRGKKDAKSDGDSGGSGKQTNEKPSEKSQDLSSDTDKGNKSNGKKAEPKDSKESKDSKEGEKPADEEKSARKTVKAKFQDQDLEIDEEAIVPVKINGQEQLVPVKDLISNYSGKMAWDQKFTELHKMRKTVATQEAKLIEASNTLKAIFEEKDADMKMFKMAQFAGIDPVQYRQKFFNDNISALEKWAAMTEDERKADALAFEAKIHKLRADTLEASSKQEQAHRELTDKIAKLRASHQVSEDEFAARYDQIAAYQNEMASKYGDYQPTQITPEYVIETIEKDRLWKAAAEKLDSLDLGLDAKKRGERLMNLVENSYKVGLKAQDMAELVDELWGSIKAQKKIEEKKQKNDEFLNGKKDVPAARAKSSEPLLFDDL